MLELLAGRPVRRVMMFVAHPDDEIVGAGAHMGRWPGLRIVHVSNGSPRNPFFASRAGFSDAQSYAAARREEAVNAAALAGISPHQISGLGFHDQDLAHLLNEMVEAIGGLIASYQPDVVVTHPYEGGHPDHDAVCFAVHQAIQRMPEEIAGRLALVEMTSYFGRDGRRVVSEFVDGCETAITISLDEDQKLLKHQMYRAHSSQYSLLSEFPLEFERFRLAPRYNFSAKPVSDELLYDSDDLGITSDEWIDLASRALSNTELKMSQPVSKR